MNSTQITALVIILVYMAVTVAIGLFASRKKTEEKQSNAILSKRDGAGFWETESITIEVLKHAKVLLIEVPMMK